MTVFKYSYFVKTDVVFKGYWFKLGVNSKINSNIIFYNLLFPSLLVTEKGIPLFRVGLMLVFGFMSIEIGRWFTKIEM